jgi:glycosyltransferase involved in cell wall biosynthesis
MLQNKVMAAADPNEQIPTLELSIVMPCLNEAETLATCIGKARDYLERQQIAGEVLIADNGSSDGSQEIATNSGARVVPIPERGV